MEVTWLAAVAFAAAIVNGALGYGFSSITVPIALLALTSRVLNPALVLVEVALNLYVLAVNRQHATWAARRMSILIVGLVPGIVVGSSFLASVDPDHVKLLTYGVLIPLILLQAAGWRRPLRRERTATLPLGLGVGLLYSVTTISGPPLALLLNNQGYKRGEFRAALAVVRVAESSMTAIAYLLLDLYTPQSFALVPPLAVGILLGVPAGALIIRKLDPETFRRICMSFDAWIVGFGLGRVLEVLRIAPAPQAYAVLATVAVIDLWLLYRFFRAKRRLARAAET